MLYQRVVHHMDIHNSMPRPVLLTKRKTLLLAGFTASVSEDDDEMAVLGDSTFKVKVADHQQFFQVCRNQAIKDVKEGVFELSFRSAVIFYPKEGRFDCVARPG